jgi:hypothetical protein
MTTVDYVAAADGDNHVAYGDLEILMGRDAKIECDESHKNNGGGASIRYCY